MPGFEWLALGGLATGLVFGLWNHIKTFVWRLASCVVVQADLDDVSSRSMFQRVWAGDFRVGRFRDLVYVGFFATSRDGTTRKFACEVIEGDRTYWLWKGWKLVLLQRIDASRVRITTLRSFFDVEREFVVAASVLPLFRAFCVSRVNGTRGMPGNANSQANRAANAPGGGAGLWKGGDSSPGFGYGTTGLSLRELRPVGISREELADDMRPSTQVLDNLALSEEQASAMLRCQRWAEMRLWYASHTVPWRLGLLLHGKPGTGKSSFAKGIAQSLQAWLYVVDLATFSNTEFVTSWDIMCAQSSPVVILLEDIDAVFDKRKNLTDTEMSAGVTFDCLLNTVSGAQDRQGILLIVTTNDVTKIDEAFLRPGRLDLRVAFSELSCEGRRKICERILCDWPALIEKTVEETQGMTGAAVQEHCEAIALEKVWEKP